MAIINSISNTASVLYNSVPIASLPAVTNLLLPPTILKTVSSALASIGDVLTYTVAVANLGLTAMSSLPFTDVLPHGVTYVDGSFTLNGGTVTPTINGQTLTYTIASIAALGTATITFRATVIGGTTP